MTLTVVPRSRGWEPSATNTLIRVSDCGTFEVSEKDLTLRLVPTEFQTIQKRRDDFVKSHPALFTRQPSWGAALDALDRASRLYRQSNQFQAPVAKESDSDPWVPVTCNGRYKARIVKIAKQFQIPLMHRAGKVLSTQQGKEILESIMAMRAGYFRDTDIWKELERRHNWKPETKAGNL